MSDAARRTSCVHCGLPVADRGKTDEPQYCCVGCRFAASLFQASDGDSLTTPAFTRLGLAVFFAMNVMVFTLALWTQDIYGPAEKEAAQALQEVFRYLCLLFSLPVFFLLAGPLLDEAALAVRCRRISSDLLLAVGVAASFIYSLVTLISGTGHVYFEVACMVLVAVTLGRFFEATGKAQTTKALRGLEKLLPDHVQAVRGETEVQIPVEELVTNDVIRVLAGGRVAVDGTVVSGRASVDQQVVTGESWPLTLAEGDRVLAGSLNLDGDLLIKIDHPPGESAVDHLVKTVTEAAGQPERWGKLADRVIKWFLPAVAIVSLGTLGFHTLNGELAAGLMAALSVVVVACPCALALATPLAVWAAVGRAARHGIVIRNPDMLSRMCEIRTYCFDKTGTLTTGQPRLSQIVSGDAGQRSTIKHVAASIARASNHRVSVALRSVHQGEAMQVSQVHDVSGRGVSAFVDQIQSMAFLGSYQFLTDHGQQVPDDLRAEIDKHRSPAFMMTYIGWGGRMRAAFMLSEELREEVEEVIGTIKRRGRRLMVLTGDEAARGDALADQLGVPVRSQQLPDDKVQAIQEIASSERVAMIGDGINDAAALAMADVGIALGCGADISRHTADVCLLGDDLRQLFRLETISQQAIHTIRKNLVCSLIYNVVAIPIAAMGMLNPIIAAIAMAVSSAMVVGSSLRLSRSSQMVGTATADDATKSAHSDARQSASDQPTEQPVWLVGREAT